MCADGQSGSDYMEVWVHDDNTRSLNFGGDTSGSQTTVTCKGSVPSSCRASTPPAPCSQVQCPCDPDTSALDFPYMRAITKEVISDATCKGSGQSRMLLIGLGGGALTMYLESHCPGLQIDAVEANKHVVDAAYGLFGLDRSGSKVSVEVADGGTAVQNRVASGSRYDFVVVDCFQAQGQVPASCRSDAFISGLRSLLKPGGKVLQQVWKAQYRSILGMYNDEFGIDHSLAEAVDGMGVNCMIVAGAQDTAIERHEVKEASADNSPHVSAYFNEAVLAMPNESVEMSQNTSFATAKWDAIKKEVKQNQDEQAQADYTDADETAAEGKEAEEEASGLVPRWDALSRGGNEWQKILKAPVDMNAHVDIKDFGTLNADVSAY